MKKEDLFEDIPHETFHGDVTKCRMTPNEVRALVDKLMKERLSEIRQRYSKQV